MKMQRKFVLFYLIFPSHGEFTIFICIVFSIIKFSYRMAAFELPQCQCITYPPLSKGWEGSAILSHGALLRFGCLAYVFSIVNTPIIDELKKSPK